MQKNYNEYNLQEYDFLKLLVSTMIVQGHNVCFDNDDLEKNLYKFYDNEKYKLLFNNISCCVFDNEDENRVLLSDSFELAYAVGMLTALSKRGSVYSVINISTEEATSNLGAYNENQIETMNDLCIELKEKQTTLKNAKIYLFQKNKTT